MGARRRPPRSSAPPMPKIRSYFRSAIIQIPSCLENEKWMMCTNDKGFPSETMVAVSVQSQAAASPEMVSAATGQRSVIWAAGLSLKNFCQRFALTGLTPTAWSCTTLCEANAELNWFNLAWTNAASPAVGTVTDESPSGETKFEACDQEGGAARAKRAAAAITARNDDKDFI